jgi:hypothetical protein
VENDAYVPSPGDIIFYDWQDSGSGDNTGTPDHVGIVEKVSGSTITVIEGNYSETVKRRYLSVNGRYIRGYGIPKYTDKVVTTTAVIDSAEFYSKTFAGAYKVTASALNVRSGAGTGKKIIATIPKNTIVRNYGYYSSVNGVKWLYVQFTQNGKVHTGFCSTKYLSKA